MRTNVDVATLDLVLLHVNLNNFHGALAGVDLKHQEFLQLSSMHGRDSFGVLSTIHRWFFDEIDGKYGTTRAIALKIDSWANVQRPAYLPKRVDDGSC